MASSGRNPKSKTTKSTSPRRGAAAKDAWRAAFDESAKPADRVKALSRLGVTLCKNKEAFDAALKVLRDRAEPVTVRRAALAALQAASFSVVAFQQFRARFLAALRAVMEDEDPELRQRVLGLLAREKDGLAQQRLLAGLKDPAKALLPPAKALQLLAYDVHSDTYPVARAIVSDPPTEEAKREALRVLAADATSVDLFESVLRDKSQSADIRQLAAAALRGLAPARLQAHARALVMDEGEPEELKVVGVTALTAFGEGALAGDTELQARVSRLGAQDSAQAKQSAVRFLARFAAK